MKVAHERLCKCEGSRSKWSKFVNEWLPRQDPTSRDRSDKSNYIERVIIIRGAIEKFVAVHDECGFDFVADICIYFIFLILPSKVISGIECWQPISIVFNRKVRVVTLYSKIIKKHFLVLKCFFILYINFTSQKIYDIKNLI